MDGIAETTRPRPAPALGNDAAGCAIAGARAVLFPTGPPGEPPGGGPGSRERPLYYPTPGGAARTGGAATLPSEAACLVTVRAAGDDHVLLDLVAARAVALCGHAPTVALQMIGLEAAGRDRGGCGVVLAIGVDPGPLPCTVLELDDPARAVALLSTPGFDDGRTILVLVGDEDAVPRPGLDRLVTAAMRNYRCALVLAQLHPAAAVLVALGEDGERTVFRREPAAPTRSPDTAPARRVARRAEPVEVCVLGPVGVRGALVPLERRPKLTELVVYLALHPGGATTRMWATALWPDRRVPAQTIANRLSEARTALGFASDGQPRLRRNGERHEIAEVSTDWDRFVALSNEDGDPRDWRAALELLRGRPFSDLHEGRWTELEGFAHEIEQRVVACGLRFGEHALADGRPDDATWGVQRALRTSPWDERLYRLLMRAADATGNWVGVEASLHHLALVLEVDGDPLAAVHPETAALYARLCGDRALAQR